MRISEAEKVLDMNYILCIAVRLILSLLRRKYLIVEESEQPIPNLMYLIC